MRLADFEQWYVIGTHSNEHGGFIETYVTPDHRYFDLDAMHAMYRELIRNDKTRVYEPGEWQPLR